ncbi:hypothetical protein FD723_37135 (plasmid) [Nostoc sp. C052]|nr:hypothetical protein FD723_37135 [Nostoc sp. C052]
MTHAGWSFHWHAAYFCIKPFSETDRTEDLKKFDIPTLVRCDLRVQKIFTGEHLAVFAAVGGEKAAPNSI